MNNCFIFRQRLAVHCLNLSGQALWLLLASLTGTTAWGQGGYNDDRVMIQGFMWESHMSGPQVAHGASFHPDWKFKWYDQVAAKAKEIAEAEIDLVWLPPPGHGDGAGYFPEELYDFNNNYGNESQHRAALKTLLVNGLEPVADIVINHRNGSGGWATFKNPNWPASYICSDDEFWNPKPGTQYNADDQDLLLHSPRGASDTGETQGVRDLDHKNPALRADIKSYLSKLKGLGYRGWRYDVSKGYLPEATAEYNFDSKPTFAVGEYWDEGAPEKISHWVNGTQWRDTPDPAKHACCAFDFPAYRQLCNLLTSGQYQNLRAISYPDGQMDGLVALNKNKAVTFLENHDTGFPQRQFDTFPNDARLMKGYAYILTHPGIPCVYWKHYFEWHHGQKIKELIKARKYAGVNSGSYIRTETHGQNYVAYIGDKPEDSSTLIVKIGPGLDFNPDTKVWGLETFGDGYSVWVRRSKKDETKAHVDGAKPAFPLPSP